MISLRLLVAAYWCRVGRNHEVDWPLQIDTSGRVRRCMHCETLMPEARGIEIWPGTTDTDETGSW